MDPLLATLLIFMERYLTIIKVEMRKCKKGSEDVDPMDRTSLLNLSWMCNQAITEGHRMPVDKVSRWLGFIQGCLACRGLIDVDEERDISRPLFHEAYKEKGLDKPKTMER